MFNVHYRYYRNKRNNEKSIDEKEKNLSIRVNFSAMSKKNHDFIM